MSKKIMLTAALVMIGFTAHAQIDNRMCLQVISNMYNESTKEVKMANNSCVAGDLKMQGFKEVSMDFDATVDEGSSKLTLITKGRYQLANTAAKCIPGSICAHNITANSKLVLSLPLLGCLDTASVTYKISRTSSGVVSVLISALNVENKGSKNVRCIAAPIASKSIELGGSIMDPSKLKVEFMQNVAE